MSNFDDGSNQGPVQTIHAGRPPTLAPITVTVIITALFGLFGLIPAAFAAAAANRAGQSGSRYWKAFGITFAVMLAAWVAAGVSLVMVIMGNVKTEERIASVQVGDCWNLGGQNIELYSDGVREVPCSGPHDVEVLVEPTSEGIGACDQWIREHGVRPTEDTSTAFAFVDDDRRMAACVAYAQASGNLMGTWAAGDLRVE